MNMMNRQTSPKNFNPLMAFFLALGFISAAVFSSGVRHA
ncbi:hypothetical protein [Polaromonas sp. CG9_12]|nr:hypothetical protein [Polaromonas sp. CG9_12]